MNFNAAKNNLAAGHAALVGNDHARMEETVRQNGQNIEAGFTLMEAMIVVVIVGIMATIAAPSFSGIIASGRVSATANDLVSDLMLARSTASANGRLAVVCPSTDGTSCSNNTADWQVGRIVFIDKTAPTGVYNPPGDTLIKYSTGLPSSLTVTMTGFPNTYIAFNSYGGMLPLGTGNFKLCITGAPQCRQISVAYSGRTVVTKVP